MVGNFFLINNYSMFGIYKERIIRMIILSNCIYNVILIIIILSKNLDLSIFAPILIGMNIECEYKILYPESKRTG